MPFEKKNNLPARTDAPEKPRKRSRLLGGINARAVGEAVLVAAVLSVMAFWQGDLVSQKLNVYLDAGKAWPVDGVLAILAAAFIALSKKVKAIHKIRFVAPLAVYGGNAIYTARERAGLSVG